LYRQELPQEFHPTQCLNRALADSHRREAACV
jgi:hypothetical protein